MKIFALWIAALVLVSAGAQAKTPGDESAGPQRTLASQKAYRECDFPKLERYLLASLNHDVEGVVVSALREVAKIKLAQPACSSDDIREKVEELVRDGSSPAVSYKAYLTAVVLASPETFVEEGNTEFATDEQFFTAIADQLERSALADAR